MLLVCPSCGTTNRVPDTKLHDSPVCGQCGAALMATAPVTLSDAALLHYLAKTELPVLVDFWAEWCGPCNMMAPQFASAAGQMPDVRFVKVDSDAAPQASTRYGIRSIPTLILFRNGAEAARLSGAMSAKDLLAWLRTQLPQAA